MVVPMRRHSIESFRHARERLGQSHHRGPPTKAAFVQHPCGVSPDHECSPLDDLRADSPCSSHTLVPLCPSDLPTMTDLQGQQRRRKARRRHGQLSLWTMVVAPVLLLLAAAGTATASQGDRSPEYNNCVNSCNLDSCLVPPTWDDGVAHYTRLPLVLRLTRWSCLDDCKYHCTHRVTNEAHERVTHIREESKGEVEAQASVEGWSRAEQRRRVDEIVRLKLAALRPVQKEMVQYHGKWVFIRLFGAQEPLSVLFSLANFSIHLSALDTLRKQVPDAFPLKLIYILHALLSCFAWLCSAVFHARDKALTERLDYFSAGAVVLGGLFYTVCRLWRFAPGSMAFKVLARTFGVLYGLHVLYLSFGRFDYGYNMKINIFVGLLHSLLWLTYTVRPALFSQTAIGEGAMGRFRAVTHSSSSSASHIHSNGGSPPVPVSTPVPVPPSSSRKGRRQLQKILAFLWLASCLELFDFPPIWRALDAHALWHAATVPLAGMWYSWLIEDARECVTSGFWMGDMDPKTAAYLQLPHKTEAAVGNVTRAVGPPVMRAVERAREWVGTAASRSSSAMSSTGTSSGIEFKALTTKLNDFARGTLGNGMAGVSNPLGATTTATVAHGRGAHGRTTSVNIGNGMASLSGAGTSDREREKYEELGGRGSVV